MSDEEEGQMYDDDDGAPAEQHPEGDAVAARVNNPARGYTEEQKLAILDMQVEGFVDTVQFPEQVDRLVDEFNQRSGTLEIKPVPGRGRGLFTKKHLPYGFVIGDYPGPRVSEHVSDTLPDDYDKIMKAPNGDSLVGDLQDPEHFSPVTFCNDPGYGGSEKNGFIPPYEMSNVVNQWNNAKQKMEFVVKSKRGVKAGEQLTFFYGWDYWEGKHYYFPSQKEYDDAHKQIQRNKKRK
jgi:hypothetical protein